MRLPAKGDPHEEFAFFVREPSIGYYFRLQHDRRLEDPYGESLTLTFVADCIYPRRGEGRSALAQFHGDARLETGAEHRVRSTSDIVAIGSLMIGKNRFDVGGFLPPSACWRLANAMAFGLVTAMLASAAFPTKGHGYVGSLSFHGRDFDPYDYVGIPRPADHVGFPQPHSR